jgi:hypothetical protein
MRSSRIEMYEIDLNSYGELMIAVPDLEVDGGASQFEVERSDCVLYFDDGDMVRLPSIPAHMLLKLRAAERIVIAEFAKGGVPLRCYECERID